MYEICINVSHSLYEKKKASCAHNIWYFADESIGLGVIS
jgi:hypothetical protein